MDELKLIVQRMINAGEPEENIAAVIKAYESREAGKITPPQKENQGVPAGEIVAPKTQPSVTELQQEDISSELQRIKKNFEQGEFTITEKPAFEEFKKTGEIKQELLPDIKNEKTPGYLESLINTFSLIPADIQKMEIGVRNFLLDPITSKRYPGLTKEQRHAKINEYFEDDRNIIAGYPGLGIIKAASTSEQAIQAINDIESKQIKLESSSILEAVENKKPIEAGYMAAKGLIRSLPSIAASYLGMPGIVLHSALMVGDKWEDEILNNPDASVEAVGWNALGSGVIQGASDALFRGLAQSAGVIAKQGSAKAAKQYLDSSFKNILKKIALVPGEGITEDVQNISNKFFDLATLGREIPDWSEYKYELFDEFVIGALMGGTLSLGGSTKSALNSQRAYAEGLLMPESIKNTFEEKIDQYNSLNNIKNQEINETAKNEIDIALKNIEREITQLSRKYKTALYAMDSNQTSEYSKNKDEVLKLKNSLNKTTTEQGKKLILDKINNLEKSNNEILKEATAKARQKTTATVTEIAKSFENLNVNSFSTDKEGTASEKIEKILTEAKIEGAKSEAFGNDGTIIRYTNEKGEVVREDILINEDIAKETESVNVAAHELLHAVLTKTLFKKGKNAINLGEALIEEIQNIDIQKINDSDLRNRISNYANLSKEQQYEEVLNLFSDAIATGDIRYDEGVFTKIGDFTRRVLQDLGWAKIKFNTGRDVYNFIKDYNRGIEKGVLSKKFIEQAKAGFEGELITQKRKSPRKTESVSETFTAPSKSKDLKKQFDSFVQDSSGKRKYKNKAEFEASEDYIKAYNAITQSNLLDGLIMQGMTEKGVIGPAMKDFVQNVKDDLTVRFVKNFDPAKNESLFGWLTGKNGVLDFAKTAEETQYVKTKSRETGLEIYKGGEIITRDLIDEDILIDEAIDLETSEGLEASTLVEPLNVLTKDDQIKKQFISTVAEKVKNIKVEDLNYKTLKDLAPELTNKIFGKSTLNKQEFIRNNAKLLYDLLPMGAMKMAVDRTKSATGIQRSLLMAFYDKGERVVQRDEIKKGIAGTAAGLNEQTKKPFYKPEFLSLFGANEGQTQDRNQITAIKALQKEIGKAITNRVVRQALESENIPTQVLFRIADGKAEIMASKGLSLSTPKLEQYHNDVEILSAALTRLSKTINGVEVKKNSKEIKEFVKESLAPHVDNFSISTKLLLRYSLSGTGKDKIESNLGKRYAIFPTIKSVNNFLNIDKKILDQVDLDDYNSILSYAGIKAITAKNNLNRTKKVLEKLKNKDKELINIIEKENSTKEKALKIFINDLIKVAKINENTEKSIYHILNIQDNYTLHAVRALHPLISFTDPSVLNADERFHDEHFSRSKRTAAYISTIIKNAIDGETADVTDSRINLLWRGMYRGIITKTQGDKFSSSKDFGPQTYISQSPLYEMNDNIEDGDLHYFLPNTTLNPYKEIKTLNELLDGLVPVKFAGNENKKLRVFDFDDTLAKSKSNVLYTMPNGNKGKLTAEQFANQGDDLAEQGAKFDFSEFSKVVKGKKGPLFNVAKTILNKRGDEDLFILTARPAEAKYAIQPFLESLGLPFKLENIIGLGNGSPQAKANWIASKLNEGYNDVYFADDALKNVKAVNETLSSYGIKYRAQAVKAPSAETMASKSLDTEFNKILQDSTGVEFYKEYSPVKAELLGRGKGKFKFFVPYDADDFVGLLYTTLAKGKTGDAQMEWYKENLLKPFSRGIQQYEAAKQRALRDWADLKAQIKKDVPAGLNKQNETGFRNQDSVRIYIWHTQGVDMTSKEMGMSKSDLNDNLKYVRKNPALKAFADKLMALNIDGYPDPTANWTAGDITTDLVSYINDVKRKQYLQPWKDNIDIIFSDKNKNKLKALYGNSYIESLDDMLYRMWNGRNRRVGITKKERAFQDWINNSVGTVMFFNSRSALLQTISAINFINFTDNNPINAAAAFANQKQYWADFSELFNSDFLKQRRSGLQIDINADEIANAAATSRNKAKAALSAILKFGFTPTQIADSFAIASGGATFYRNRIKKYLKEGLTKEEAQKKAFEDFQETAEESQQSARPDRISMQQASSLGRTILAWGNTPMQYARIQKKAALDLINGRGDWKTNVSKIMYYGVIQNIIFSALQQGMFALLFSDEEDEKEKERYFRVGNSMLDTFLRGAGIYGAVASTAKNVIMEIIDQAKSSRPDYTQAAIAATTISPPINSKLRKLISAGKTFTYKQSKEKVFTEGFSLENPAFLAGGKVISAVANIPVDRVVQKADHIYTAMKPETELWQSLALSLGWSEWDLGMIEKQTKKSATKVVGKRGVKKRGVKK